MYRVLFFFIAIMLSGCASNPLPLPGLGSPAPSLEFNSLYLRGVFNWWEASNKYKFTSGSDGWYVDVELIADGQPYDFRISDANWSPKNTCGAKYQGQVVSAETPVYLICNPGLQNVQFTPNKTGKYRFILVPASAGEVSLTVTRID